MGCHSARDSSLYNPDILLTQLLACCTWLSSSPLSPFLLSLNGPAQSACVLSGFSQMSLSGPTQSLLSIINFLLLHTKEQSCPFFFFLFTYLFFIHRQAHLLLENAHPLFKYNCKIHQGKNCSKPWLTWSCMTRSQKLSVRKSELCTEAESTALQQNPSHLRISKRWFSISEHP